MELRHLRYFIAVAEELSFSRAAERLQMAQPPLSQQIQALEAEMGVKLFDRKKRPLQLTVAGQAFAEEAQLTLANLEQAVQRTQRIYQGELGHLTIGFTSSVANGVLPDILRTFRQRYPDIKLILREENTAFQLQGLRDRKTDVAFVYQYHEMLEEQDLEMITLAPEPLLAVLPQNHRLARCPKIALSDLENEEFVLPRPQVASGLQEQIYQICSQAGFMPKVAQEAVFMVTILGLVSAEIGISILPASVQSLQRKGVVYRPLDAQTTATKLTVIWRRHHASPVLAQFLDIVSRADRAVETANCGTPAT
jgi:DNA-binding transcriptional LysR family regulator